LLDHARQWRARRTDASDFVRGYYASLVYTPADLVKFYDEDNATVWRDELGERPVPRIQTDSGPQVAVTTFTVLPLESGFSLVVNGDIAFRERPRAESIAASTLSCRTTSVFLPLPPGESPGDGEDVVVVPAVGKGAEQPPAPDAQAQKQPAEGRAQRPVGRRVKGAGGDGKGKAHPWSWRSEESERWDCLFKWKKGARTQPRSLSAE
jgi:hypothetical protein